MNVDDFKRDLKALLDKYDVSIDFEADDGSDWYGMSGEHICVCDNKRPYQSVTLASGVSVDGSDL